MRVPRYSLPSRAVMTTVEPLRAVRRLIRVRVSVTVIVGFCLVCCSLPTTHMIAVPLAYVNLAANISQKSFGAEKALPEQGPNRHVLPHHHIS